MYTVPGCRIQSKIYESSASLVFRGIWEADGVPVILKILKEDYPSSEELVRYRQEYELTRNLDIRGIIKARSQEKYGNSLAIILEDFGGESLKIHEEKRAFPLTKILSLAIRVTHILGELHEAKVIHKDINPSNIVYNPTSDELKIIDFGISTKLSREMPELKNPERLEGTLAYMSPEQTGRMNRVLDYRTDFYALGATLYELCSGSLPFTTSDPLELTHCHLAREPVPPHEINKLIPNSLSQVILKLLEKRAEDRYQTSRGLIVDLELCLNELVQKKNNGAFTPGGSDVSGRFSLPQKLYGREHELESITNAANRAAQGSSEVLFLTGYSGAGKSALVKELYKTLQNGYIIAGKFDQYHRDIPYSAARDAFRGLIRQLLMENEERLLKWKTELHVALSPNGQVMIEFLPELELIIGEQPPVPDLDAAANRNRFTLVLRNFALVFLRKEHPLTLFLDDLQWADLASLELIKLITSKSKHLFLIGAYRNNEVGPNHPLLLNADEMRKAGTPLDTIALPPLGLANVAQYIADATRRTVTDTHELAELVKHKTDGNPFFMEEFLKTMVRKELLTFDSRSGSWIWNIEAIQAQNITDNVVDLISARVDELEVDTRATLTKAACLGNTFDLKALSQLHEKSQAETARDLWPAMELNMILPLRDEYKIATLEPLNISTPENERQYIYKFAHDRIEEASYNLLPERERESLHLKAGRLLLQTFSSTEESSGGSFEKEPEQLFSIVDHLNLSRKLILDRTERDELAKLNQRAGSRAQSSTAYTAALAYYKIGLELLDDSKQSPWQRTYDLTLTLTTRAAEAAMLARDFAEMDLFTEEALKQATDILDSAKIYELQIQAFTAQNNLTGAIKTALPALKKLGVHLPGKPGNLHIFSALLMTKLRMTGKSPEHILNLPRMQAPTALAASRILEQTMAPAFFSIPELFPLIIFQQIKLSLKYGNSQETPYFYVFYGMILTGVLNDVVSGYQYGKLAIKLMEHLNVAQSRARVIFVFNTFIRHWKEPLHDSIRPLMDVHKTALEIGDLEYATYGLNTSTHCSFCAGINLKEREKEVAIQAEIIAGLGQNNALNYANLFLQGTRQLIEKTEQPSILSGEAYDEKTMLPIHKEIGDKTALFRVFFWKLLLAYLFQEPAQNIIPNADEAGKYMEAVPGMPELAAFHLYDSLARLGTYPTARPAEQKRILKKVKANQKKLKLWAEHAPMNQSHRYYLVAAEEARVQENLKQARDFYDRAIELARKNDYQNDEALCWELAGRFYRRNGPAYLARFFLGNARYTYSRWGADAKVTHMATQYPEIFAAGEADNLVFTNVHSSSVPPKSDIDVNTSTSNTAGGSAGTLDLFTIMKASQMITGETELDKLLRKLMGVVLENAGARRGLLLLKREEHWFIEALGEPEQDEISVLQSLPMEEGKLPITLVNYVIHTKETVVLDHASRSGPFVEDPFVQKNKLRSVLCLPLIHQGKLTGVLYLGNRLTEGAFTRDRLELMEVLSAQIAISIQIALSREAERARIKAEAANRAKSDFLASMSHELRTPLNGILGYAQILDKAKNLTDNQQEGIDTIRNSGNHLLTLIDDILDLSKIEADRLELFPEVLRLPELMESITTLFRVQALQKNLTFSYKSLTPLPSAILADEKRLRQILLNLLSNAMRYTKQGRVDFHVAHENEKLRFEVKDTGVGIRLEDQKKIFEPFRQAGDAHRAPEGTGLGLSICNQLAEMMDGRLSVSSVPGEGSTFTFEVSLPETAVITERDAASRTVRGYSGRSCLILIVDDNTSNRRLLRNLLDPLGFDILEAKDGKDALEKARKNPPDLILMDLAMPIMDGFACTQEIRKDERLKNLPIIAVTAGVFEKDRQAALSAGTNVFLGKPIDIEKLLKAMGNLLELEWEYEQVTQEEQGDLPSETLELIGPSPEQTRKLLKLTKLGDIGGVLELAKELEKFDTKLTPFAREVRQLANGFQLRALAEFVETFI